MPDLPSLTVPKPRKLARVDDSVSAPVSVFESETLAVFHETTPYSEHAVLHVVAAMIVSVLVLAGFVKLDRVVAANGTIVPTEGSIFVQPLDRSIVKDIRVRSGDVVKKGQLLATLDPTFAAADLGQYRQQVQSRSALVARLQAERAGAPFEAPTGADPDTDSQASIWRHRQKEFEQGLADFDFRFRSTQAKIDQANDDMANYAKRRDLAKQIETMDTTLQQHGFGSKLNSLLSTSNVVDFERQRANSENQISQGQHDLDSLKAQREVYVTKWQEDIGTQLVAAENDLALANQGLAKAKRVSQLINLEAPADAVVLQIGKASIGSVVDPSGGGGDTPSGPLFTLVPIGGKLEADVQIDAQDIGYVRPGDRVVIKLEAYPFMRHGTASGTITTISEGSFTQGSDGEKRSPYFKARVSIDDVHLHNVPASMRLIPGMTLVSDIMLGKRSVLSYLVDGALRTGSEAMREP